MDKEKIDLNNLNTLNPTNNTNENPPQKPPENQNPTTEIKKTDNNEQTQNEINSKEKEVIKLPLLISKDSPAETNTNNNSNNTNTNIQNNNIPQKESEDEVSKDTTNLNNENKTLNKKRERDPSATIDEVSKDDQDLKTVVNNDDNKSVNEKKNEEIANKETINKENENKESENKENKENNNNAGSEPLRKKITFAEAKKNIEEFKNYLAKTEENIKKKYGNNFVDFSCEEKLPIDLQSKLITKFFESDEMKKIISKMENDKQVNK